MAVKIEFSGYVNRVREYDWGVAYDVSHNQLIRKNDQWQVAGRDYFSVVGPEGAPLFAENDVVHIKGTLKTKVYDKKDGSGKGIALNVRAEEMVKDGQSIPDRKPSEDALREVFGDLSPVDDDVPF